MNRRINGSGNHRGLAGITPCCWAWIRSRVRGTAMAAILLSSISGLACPGPSKQGGGPGPAGPPPTSVERPDPAAGPRPARAHPDSRKLPKDEVLSFGGGGRVTVPQGWHVTEHKGDGPLVLEEPDRELWISLVFLEAAGALEAISGAWKRARPGFALAAKETVSPPAKDGWDQVTQVVYQTPSRERRVVVALARGKGKRYYVTLLDARIAALDRRGAQMQTVLGSLTVPGVGKESFAGKSAHALDEARLAAFEAFVNKSRQDLDVTGAAIAIVQGGKVVYQKGFGLRRRGAKAPVTPKTLFMIGSISKSLTSMMMARLVDDKKFSWETPVSQVYPGFALGDPDATKLCQMRHTLCACTGLPRQDLEFLFEYRGATPEGRLKLLGSMKPTTGFGETFQYSNLLVAAGGYIAARAAFPKLGFGPAYLRAMDSFLLRPAGMKSTTYDTRRAARQDHAVPHSPSLELKYEPIPLAWEDTVLSVGPAGGAWSNVEDMARYLLLELGRGKTPEGKVVVSSANLERRWERGVRMSNEQAYGLAMVVGEQGGLRILGHGGGTLGFSTNMVFLPDHGVGLVSLTNNGGGSGGWNGLVLRRLLELLFDAEPRAEKALEFISRKLREDVASGLKEMDLAPGADFLSPYLGAYSNEALGRITLRLHKGKGIFDAGEWQASLAKHTGKDGVVRLVIGAPLAGLSLDSGKDPEGRRTLTLQSAQQKYVFTEVAGPKAGPRPAAPRPAAPRPAAPRRP